MDRAYSFVRRCVRYTARMYYRAFVRLLADDGFGLSSQMAYNALFSVFPGLLVLITVAGALGLGPEDVMPRLMELAGQHLPQSTVQLLERNLPDLLQVSATHVVAIGPILLVWITSNFLDTVLKALSIAYRLPRMRHFLVRRLMALGLVVLFGLASAISFNLVVFGGPRVVEFMQSTFNFGEDLGSRLRLLRWTVTPVSMLLSTMLMYAIVPTKPLKLQMVWPGAVTFTLLWIMATWLFTAYIGRAAFVNLHGLIAHVIVLMMWFYLSSLLLFYGAEVNAVWFHMRHYDMQHPEIPLR